MFWKSAKIKYGQISSDDQDILKYQQIASEFQEGSYSGIVGYIQDLGHRWVAGRTPQGRTLEIGAGAGRHASFHDEKGGGYYISEYSRGYLQSKIWRETKHHGVQCDARSLPYRSSSFQSVISIYNLEHITELQKVLGEVHRVLKPGGVFLVALPCEGGLLWNIGRQITTRREFIRRYGINYDKIIAYEHVWDFSGVLRQITGTKLFRVDMAKMMPFWGLSYHLNLIGCFQCSVMK